ncbi:universal stress protein [Candidatus Kuenenia sp.]|uniref:universal stress protein n=1 Tax=Candidatus Kuenenia sp. TaxID=2499824 RepID=UPI00322039E5
MIHYQNILCPVDYSNCSMNALAYAAKLAIRDTARLYLIYVKEEHTSDYGGLKFDAELNRTAETDAEIEQKLLGSIPEEIRCCINIETLIRAGTPFEEILKAARNMGTDLIVIGTHGRTGISHMFIGSVAEKVIRNAPCPVLCIRG